MGLGAKVGAAFAASTARSARECGSAASLHKFSQRDRRGLSREQGRYLSRVRAPLLSMRSTARCENQSGTIRSAPGIPVTGIVSSR